MMPEASLDPPASSSYAIVTEQPDDGGSNGLHHWVRDQSIVGRPIYCSFQ